LEKQVSGLTHFIAEKHRPNMKPDDSIKKPKE
jgi:hypothetical protein